MIFPGSLTDMQTWTGLDEAIIGRAMRCGQNDLVAYSAIKIREILLKDGMEEEEAIEWIEYNIIGAWVGAGTPIIVWDFDLDEFKENPDG